MKYRIGGIPYSGTFWHFLFVKESAVSRVARELAVCHAKMLKAENVSCAYFPRLAALGWRERCGSISFPPSNRASENFRSSASPT